MRPAIASLLLALAGCAGAEPYFVDQLEDGRALVIDAHGHALHLDARLLPADAGEGRWVGEPPENANPAAVAALRARLSADDDGKALVLGAGGAR